jgi:hypothetical protein
MTFEANDLDPSLFEESALIAKYSIFTAGSGSPIEVMGDKDFHVESGARRHFLLHIYSVFGSS